MDNPFKQALFNVYHEADKVKRHVIKRKTSKKRRIIENTNTELANRKAAIMASYEKSKRMQADYAKFQTRRIHNTVNRILPENKAYDNDGVRYVK